MQNKNAEEKDNKLISLGKIDSRGRLQFIKEVINHVEAKPNQPVVIVAVHRKGTTGFSISVQSVNENRGKP